MKFNLHVKDLDQSLDELTHLHGGYISHFVSKTRNVVKQSFQYIQGKLLEQGKGNMCRYAKSIPDCNNQSLQHFVSDSPWEHEPVLDHIQRDVTQYIGDRKKGALHVDECGFPKQGKDSVGAQSQYCGRLGKVANCQIGVFLGYNNGPYRTLIDERLYLPEKWADDQMGRERCGVPDDIVFKTKIELAWDMILHAKKNHVPFGWIGMDCFFGRDSILRDRINRGGMIYIADIPCDTLVWFERPEIRIPERREGVRGRNPTRMKAIGESPIRVQDLQHQLLSDQGDHVFIRDTERKELWSTMATVRVFPVVDALPGDECWLIIRRDDGEDKVKYQLSNAPLDTSLQRFAQMSGSRYWIERTFEDGKGIAGLADYQVRSWTGWHHHMTMTLLAMLYILMLMMDLGEKADFLTVQDVKEILEVIMPKEKVTKRELLHHLLKKHKARESSRRSHHRRNK
jgi:SRSO17 transposase